MKTFICPVCGYDKLETDACEQDYNICPCCMTEFGTDDCIFDGTGEAKPLEDAWKELRQKWIEGGYKWFSHYTKPPENWNPQEQLRIFDKG